MLGTLHCASFDHIFASLFPHPPIHNFASKCCGILPPSQSDFPKLHNSSVTFFLGCTTIALQPSIVNHCFRGSYFATSFFSASRRKDNSFQEHPFHWLKDDHL